MPKVSEEQEQHAQMHALRLLNELEAVLTGWVLGYDRERVTKIVSPLYEMCDQESPARKRTREVEEAAS